MLYLFSFKNLEKPIILSEKRNISLTNITSNYEKQFFKNLFFKYEVNPSTLIIPQYFSLNSSFEKIIKIDLWINLENYTNNKFSMREEERNLVKNDTLKIEENHNILNVFLFALSLIVFNSNLDDINIHLENIDSNRYKKLEGKILTKNLNKYLDFSVFEKDLIDLFWFFDFQYSKYNLENFIYIWELLEIYKSTKSDYFKFSQLVAIIEFLLITNKKNLTEQFIFKTGIIQERLVSRNSILDRKNFSISIFNKIDSSRELEAIYDIRSYIVHGNINKIHTKYPKKEWEFNDFYSLFDQLKLITAGLLYTYIQEPEYIDFLKMN